jgi:hypothetical protein
MAMTLDDASEKRQLDDDVRNAISTYRVHIPLKVNTILSSNHSRSKELKREIRQQQGYGGHTGNIIISFKILL